MAAEAPRANVASELAERLATAPRLVRRRLLERYPETAHPAVVRRLLEMAEKQRRRDVPESIRLTKRALEAALRSARVNERRALAADLCAEAWASLANLDRIRGRLSNAERLWRRADAALALGSGDKLLLVEVLGQHATLLRSQRQFHKAADFLAAALKAAKELEDPHEEGKLRAALSIVYSYSGHAERAFDELLRSLELLDPAREPELHLWALHVSVLYLTELGRHDQALVMAQACEVCYFLLEDEVLALRGRWIKGRLHHRCHEPKVAEWYLDRARRGFRDKGLAYEAALATLDLALIHAERHDLRKVKHLVEEMYPVFIDKGIPREASASLILFADSARRHGATAAELSKVIDRLHGLRLH